MQPPSQPNITPITALTVEAMTPTQQIEHLNRMVATLRSQLEGKSEKFPQETLRDVRQILDITDTAASSNTDLGSLYAQQRSLKLCMRSGGEGRQLPRYLQNENQNQDQNQNIKLLNPTDVSAKISVSKKLESGILQKPTALSSPLPNPIIEQPITSTTSIPIIVNGKKLSGVGVTYEAVPITSSSDKSNPISLPAGTASVAKSVVPPKKIMKLVGQAVKEWNMIEEGDCLLLGM